MSDHAIKWAKAQAVSDLDAKAVLVALATRHRDGDDVVRVEWAEIVDGARKVFVVKLVGCLHFLHVRGLIKLPCIADTMTITLLMDDERAGEARR